MPAWIELPRNTRSQHLSLHRLAEPFEGPPLPPPQEREERHSQLVQLLGGDDDRVLAGQRHEAAVVVPERVLHAGDLEHT